MQREHDYFLKLAGNLLLGPLPIAALLKQLPLRCITTTTGPSYHPLTVRHGCCSQEFGDTRPLHSGTFGTRLLRYGLTPHAGRNTAMVTLAADLDRIVIGLLIGVAGEDFAAC